MARVKTAKAAKKAAKFVNRCYGNEVEVKVMTLSEEELKKEEEDKKRIAVLYNPNLSCIEKCNIIYGGAFPTMPEDDSNAEVTKIRKEAIALLAYYFIQFGTLLGRDERVNAKGYYAYCQFFGNDAEILEPTRLLVHSLVTEDFNEEQAKFVLTDIKWQVANGLDKLSTFLEEMHRGDYDHKEGVDDEYITFRGEVHERRTFRLKVRFIYGIPKSYNNA